MLNREKSSAPRRPGQRRTTELCEHEQVGLVPPALPDDFAALLEDIRQHGIRNPLDITRDGRILDGRHRFRAARSLKMAAVPVRFVSPRDELDPESFILRSALRVKHLTDDQRAVLAYEFTRRRKVENQQRACRLARAAKAQKRAGKKPVSGAASETAMTDSWEEAQRLFAVPERKMRAIKRLAKKESPFLVKVRSGEMGLLEARRLTRIQTIQLDKARRQADAKSLPPINELICGDCLKVIPRLPDRTFSLLLTDPPWGCGYDQPWRVASPRESISNDTDPKTALRLFDRMLTAVAAKMRHDCKMLVFVPWRHEPQFRAVIEKHRYSIRDILYWVRNMPTFPAGSNFSCQCTQVIYAVKGNPRIYPRRTNVFRARTGRRTDHPCENPVDILKQLIECTTVEGESVLDPFAGSGSCLEAAWSIGREAVGIEQKREHYLEALARLSKLARGKQS